MLELRATMLGWGPWLVVELLGQLLWVLCWVWLGFLCKDNRAMFWEGCCKEDWVWACRLCSWEMLPVCVLCWFSFCWIWLWMDWVRDWLSMGFWLNKFARRCLFSCSILRMRSSASRWSTACCSLSFRLLFTSSSISNSSSRTRATQFSGILIPGREEDYGHVSYQWGKYSDFTKLTVHWTLFKTCDNPKLDLPTMTITYRLKINSLFLLNLYKICM